jgi:hypothetical protein
MSITSWILPMITEISTTLSPPGTVIRKLGYEPHGTLVAGQRLPASPSCARLSRSQGDG